MNGWDMRRVSLAFFGGVIGASAVTIAKTMGGAGSVADIIGPLAFLVSAIAGSALALLDGVRERSGIGPTFAPSRPGLSTIVVLLAAVAVASAVAGVVSTVVRS